MINGIVVFGQWLVKQDWSELNENKSPSQIVTQFEAILKENLDKYLPQKSVKITNKDKPYITSDIKTLDRLKKREYCKHGKSDKYMKLKEDFDRKLKKAASEYLSRNVTSLLESDPGKAHYTLKKMGAREGDLLNDGYFNLLSHMEENLTTKESTDRIAQHFAQISQEYSALNVNCLPKKVKDSLNPNEKSFGTIPVISELEVFNQLCRIKKTKSGVPGDLPRSIVKEFSPELARPLMLIFNKIIQTGEWPSNWQIEHGIPLQKSSNPVNEDDLRIISLTPLFSKVMEKFVIDWLLKYVGPKIDLHQYGGQKGNSVSHYLIEFVNFILYNQDLKEPQATLAVFVDYSKAFNRLDNNTHQWGRYQTT